MFVLSASSGDVRSAEAGLDVGTSSRPRPLVGEPLDEADVFGGSFALFCSHPVFSAQVMLTCPLARFFSRPRVCRFYSFAPLTLIPIQKKLLDHSLLTSKELDWLDDYHKTVWTKLNKLVEDEEALAWLKEATAPVVRQ